MKKWLFVWVVVAGFALPSQAQYFGKNKVRYTPFHFRVLQSPHFELYHYLQDSSRAADFLQSAEQWYAIHQMVFADTFHTPNPVILYSHHGDFQQTGAISGLIDVGTGGVTEGLKNRVVMPLMFTRQETEHVLGHELVHAFQYHILKNEDSLSLQSIQNLPLWMVEGLAEYLSLGRIDPHTALWMRDTYIHDYFPTLDDLDRKPHIYFPYRYGQSFWALIAGLWGDEIIRPFFVYTARYGLDAALQDLLSTDRQAFSKLWKEYYHEYYASIRLKEMHGAMGDSVLRDKRPGRMQLSPSLSPDGRYMAYLSERDLFSIDLFLVDMQSGKVIRRLLSTDKEGHIDALSYLETAGSWSPDGRLLAFVVYVKGKPQPVIIDVQSGKIKEQLFLKDVEAVNHPAWSPDGRLLAFSGLRQGQSDLYVYDFQTKEVRRLTNDRAAQIQPAWSPDGRQLVFATDAVALSKGYAHAGLNIGIYDMGSGSIRLLDFFPGADNVNPLFSPDGQSILFLSNRDGFRNLYCYEIVSGNLEQLTQLPTGITGVTALSPAITIDRQGQVVYVYYENKGYRLYRASLDDFPRKAVNPEAVDFTAATLAPVFVNKSRVVSRLIARHAVQLPADSLHAKPLQRRFQLSYIGNTGIGISTSRWGTGVAGGVVMLFSDILGDHHVFASLGLNGDILDAGGSVFYLNQSRRLNWGIQLSHIPYRFGSVGIFGDTLAVSVNGQNSLLPVDVVQYDLGRLFEEKIGGLLAYPLSRSLRWEAGLSYARYHYNIQRFRTYYYFGQPIAQSKENIDAPPGFNLYSGYLAYVGDNSFYGLASPARGWRYRFEWGFNAGEFEYQSALLDYRRYWFVRPFTFALRAYHLGRYGGDSERITPLYLGFPGLVHGYDNIAYQNYLQGSSNYAASVENLYGSRLAVVNAEWRIPLLGPRSFALIGSNFLPAELNLFFDGGIAWNEGNRWVGKEEEVQQAGDRVPVWSTGISIRFALFGQIVLEPYYAFALQRSDITGTFGFNLLPAW
ncbi:eIF2A-related protein [Thermonema rossianum]|uniref:eIF2A-related protein n=1 Tax=Thermonema rossianum TaxID=55505 RepID=UPI00056EFF4F|nr:PD40 domain-containing protein [Thermonema rossianum]